MRILCDEMLSGLGRWLRAAGHDTAVAVPGTDDRAVIAQAEADERLLLTRDRHLAEVVQPRITVLLLEAGTLDAQARELRHRIGLDWLPDPFSRCMLDNTPLVPADAAETGPVPDAMRDEPLRRCPACRRVYWPGGHVRRMLLRLEGWQRCAAPEPPG
jgi:uncharacterized protein